MRVLRWILYASMAVSLLAGWAFFYWQAGAVDLAAGNAARSALNELRAVDARWSDQLIGARLSSGSGGPLRPVPWGKPYAQLEQQALRLPHPEMGRALNGVRDAFSGKARILERIAAEPRIDQLVDQAWLEPTAPRLDAFSRVLDRAFDDALGQAELYRAWLLYYSGFLLVVLAYALLGLYRANAQLEARVAERSRQLAEAQAMLVQTEKMSSLGQMVAGLAHEVNTPLAYAKASLESVGAGVAGAGRVAEQARRLIDLLSADEPDDAAIAAQLDTVRALVRDERGRQALAALETQVRDGLHGLAQIAELVANLKDFSRLDRSKVAEVDLHAGIDSTLRIARQHLGRRKVSREFGALPRVTCSPSQVNQVILNLVVNAAQATPEEGGVIAVRTAMRDDAHVAIEVADNGGGIPADVLPRIFDPFFTTKGPGKGTGLGLSICYKIAESHGGSLEVSSTPGAGSRFILVLPLRAAPVA